LPTVWICRRHRKFSAWTFGGLDSATSGVQKVTRSGLQFKYVFRDGADMTFLLPELFAPNFAEVLDRMRNRHGAVVKIVEASITDVEHASAANTAAVEPSLKLWRVA
jgi:hypothetical protein